MEQGLSYHFLFCLPLCHSAVGKSRYVALLGGDNARMCLWATFLVPILSLFAANVKHFFLTAPRKLKWRRLTEQISSLTNS